MSTREKKVVRKRKNFGIVLEFIPIVRDLYPDEDTLNNINGELKGAKAVTPQYLADKYKIKVSTAKKILRDAEENDIIECVVSSRRTKIYKSLTV